MHVVKLAAFSDGDTGGNPAGVVVASELPSEEEMPVSYTHLTLPTNREV